MSLPPPLIVALSRLAVVAALFLLPGLVGPADAASGGRGAAGAGGRSAAAPAGGTASAPAGGASGRSDGSTTLLPLGGIVRGLVDPIASRLPPISEQPDDEDDRPHPPRRLPPRQTILRPVDTLPVTPPTAPKVRARPVSRPQPPGVVASSAQVPNEVLVVPRAGVPTDAAATLARRHALDLVDARTFTLSPTTIDRFRMRDRRSVATVLRALAADPLVLSAQPNHLFTLSGSDATTGLAKAQYAITTLHLPEAHHMATGHGVTVAVIDSLVDTSHPALTGAIGDGTDLLGPEAPQAPDPHGTAIVGLIGARATLDSAAPQARILPIRAFARQTDGAASGTTFLVLRGLDWAAAHDARIVNMSFAGPQDALMSTFLAAGAAKGAVYVAAAGNAGPGSPPLYPAADPHVLAVTATDAENRLYPMANRGSYVAVAAPGADIVVATPGGGFGYTSGTSMAAAEISGIVALMLQEEPDLTPAAVRAALTGTSHPLAPADAALDGGAGLADAQGVLTRLAVPNVATGRAVAARP